MQAVHNHLNRINYQLGGSITRLEDDRILQYHNGHGVGKVYSVFLTAGISYTGYDMEVERDMVIDLDNPTGSVLYFIYCLKGNMEYGWENEGNRRGSVEELQTVILGSKRTSLKLYVPESDEISFAIIRIDRTNGLQADSTTDVALNQKLFHQFMSFHDNQPFEYHGTFNLRIKEQLLQIGSIKQTGIVRKLLVKGIIHFALALELMHHQSDMSKNEDPLTTLAKNELIHVKTAVDTIIENPELPYPVDKMCRDLGLSAAKLQEGFRILTGYTVNSFVKKERIEMAEKLIKEGNLNISEVVYTIGFTSRSYFSKIFRKRYRCTPKYYQEKCRVKTLSE